MKMARAVGSRRATEDAGRKELARRREVAGGSVGIWRMPVGKVLGPVGRCWRPEEDREVVGRPKVARGLREDGAGGLGRRKLLESRGSRWKPRRKWADEVVGGAGKSLEGGRKMDGREGSC
ncbi:hypothetical protein FNV43_RR21205 [Rhamnella rubrinervis]|uniref:Uncharacterized protein n=1 Tax=Rhamnella rubrinervis TaxID=2594499 RepID=A0A8K0E0B0_9ROSA|nr:hypothetical protein FNV43_RR21205 [Rhamnella rubrinervis]